MRTERKLSVWVKVLLLIFFAAILFVGEGVGSMGKILGAKAREVKKLIVN